MSSYEKDPGSGQECSVPVATAESEGSSSGDWDDWEEDDLGDTVVCLYSSEVATSVEDALRIDTETHGFDFKSYRHKVCWDSSVAIVRILNCIYM